jgi:hypothetical protein
MKYDDENFENIELPPPKKPVSFSIKIEASMFKRLSKHVQAIEYIEELILSKNQWIEKAIKEKIEKLKLFSLNEMESDKNLHIYVSSKIDKEMTEIVEKFRRHKISISKAKIIVDAIFERLKKEENGIKKQLQNMLTMANQEQDAKSHYN